MRVHNLRSEQNGDRARVVATVTWEDCDRPQREIHFETDKQFADGLSCNPDAFLLSCIIPALWHGEKRVSIEGEICPELHDGLIMAMSVIRHWYGLTRELVTIEAPARQTPSAQRASARAAFFFTGGVDSLAALRLNRLHYSHTHPNSVKDGIYIFGLETDNPETFKDVVDYLSPLADDARINLVPVYTNERQLDDDWDFWLLAFEGAVLCAAAHALSRRLSLAFVGSSIDVPNLHPIASHPLLDPNYSSYELRIRHDNAALSRLDKIRILAGWDMALRHLRVCNRVETYTSEQFNCGRCEKCVRTMLGLYLADALEKAPAFPETKLTEEFVREFAHINWKAFRFWPELIRALEQKGRPDLARAGKYALSRFYGETGWKGAIRKMDRVFFGGSVFRLKRAIVKTPVKARLPVHPPK
jgi:hypothetical protein